MDDDQDVDLEPREWQSDRNDGWMKAFQISVVFCVASALIYIDATDNGYVIGAISIAAAYGATNLYFWITDAVR